MTTSILIYIPWSLFPFPELAYWRSFLELSHWPTDNWNSKLFLNFLHFYSETLPIYELSVGDYVTSKWSLFLICISYVQKCLLILKAFFILHHFNRFYSQHELNILYSIRAHLLQHWNLPCWLWLKITEKRNYSWFNLYCENYKPRTRTSNTLIKFFFHLRSLILGKLCLLQRHAHPGPIQSIPSLMSSLLWCVTMTSHICHI